MNQYYFISDAAKAVKVESHVLRYWEDELHLPIKRNELGHRYYTQDDVERFKQIKGMKERGLQLKAIRMILRDGKLDMLSEIEEEKLGKEGVKEEVKEEVKEGINEVVKEEVRSVVKEQWMEGPKEQVQTGISADFKEDKARKLQWLLQEMIRQTIHETNQELYHEIRDSIVKELDYQFRMQEEREDAREQRMCQRDEEYYRRMDELLRIKSRRGKIEKGKKDSEVKTKALTLEEQLQKEVESIMAEKTIEVEGKPKARVRSAEAVEEAIREKSNKQKKRHFF